METSLSVQSIVDDANRSLLKGSQIDSNDPIVANIILNQVILERYVSTINQTLEEQHNRLLKALELEEASARRIASKVITQSTDYLIDNIHATGEQLQEQLRLTLRESKGIEPAGFKHWLFGLVGLAIGMIIGLVF
jgi:hypothetical protein